MFSVAYFKQAKKVETDFNLSDDSMNKEKMKNRKRNRCSNRADIYRLFLTKVFGANFYL